jgi:acyl carrier protein
MSEINLAELKREIKALIIETSKIPDITPEDIIDDAPIFGEGLGLDSIDSLEIVLALQKKYEVGIDDQNLARNILQSINTIADFVVNDKLKKENK